MLTHEIIFCSFYFPIYLLFFLQRGDMVNTFFFRHNSQCFSSFTSFVFFKTEVYSSLAYFLSLYIKSIIIIKSNNVCKYYYFILSRDYTWACFSLFDTSLLLISIFFLSNPILYLFLLRCFLYKCEILAGAV